jgi:hypothetical protein
MREALTLGLFILICAVMLPASGAVIGASYVADTPFPQYAYFWTDSSQVEWGPQEQMDDEAVRRSLGGTFHVYLRNRGAGPITVDDVLLDGTSLKRALAFDTSRKYKGVAHAASIFFSDLSEAERRAVIDDGEPIWYRIDPQSIAPSATGEITVRLRHTPKVVHLTVVASDGTEDIAMTTVPQPRVEGISFSNSLDRAYLYFARADRGHGVTGVQLDGVDVTSGSNIGRDPKLAMTPVTVSLESPLDRGSYHCFQATYDDGKTAIAGVRAYSDEFAYGVWGAKPGKEAEVEIGRAHVANMGVHNINMQMEIIGSDAVRAYMKSDEGRQAMKSLGIKMIVGEPDKAWSGALAWYLADEPDTADFRIDRLPPQSRVGAIGQGLIEHANSLRQTDPSVPNMLNVDMTFKPDNWYVYGQLPDIFAADPYYQTRLAQAYWSKPGTIPYYSKATFVYAVGAVCQSSCAPKPLHLMLNSTKLVKGDREFRFGTPDEKRIEAYYALAAGAKGLSYWWLLPVARGADGSSGCMEDTPEAKALWDTIGLLGAEIRTAGPIIMRSCPAEIPVVASKWVWTRALVAGTDTLVLLVVNDNYACDRLGTIIQPVEKAEISIALPAWPSAKSVFEISHSGVSDVTSDQAENKLNIQLGTLDVARMIIITSDPGLRSILQTRYDTQFASNVKRLLP